MINLKNKNCSLVFFLYLFLFFKETFAIHHHPRLPINFLENSIFFGKKRVIILNTTKNEILNLRKEIDDKICEIENRKIEFLYKKQNEYFFLKNDKREDSITYTLPYKISIIGLDGFLKFSNSEIESIEKYFAFIDQMPLRKKEKKFDELCN